MRQWGICPRYTRICTVYHSPDGESVKTYGVAMVSVEGTVEFPDVDLSATAVDRLIRWLRMHRVEPCHFRDVVMDYIELLATP